MSNLAKMNETKQGNSDSGPSNTPMSTDPETVRQAELEAARERAESYERRFRNVTHQVGHAQASKKRLEEHLETVQAEGATQLAEAAAANETLSSTISSLTETVSSQSAALSDMQQELDNSEHRIDDLTKQVCMLHMRDVRAKAKLAKGDEGDEEEEGGIYHMKDGQGIFTNETRALARNLVQLGVPAVNVNDVIHTVAQPMGITVDGIISDRTVRRTVLEGGIAAQVQFADEVHHAQSMSYSFRFLINQLINYKQLLQSLGMVQLINTSLLSRGPCICLLQAMIPLIRLLFVPLAFWAFTQQ